MKATDTVKTADSGTARREDIHVSLLYRQAGLSLVELMIALALGLFIVAGIFQVTVGSRQSFEVIQAQAATQESGRFATRFIADSARNAGYINLGNVEFSSGDDFAQTLIDTIDFSMGLNSAWPAEGVFEAGAVVAGSDSATGVGLPDAKANSDLLQLRMQGDGNYDTVANFSMSDCQGSMLDQATDTRTIVNYYVDDSNNLVCKADLTGGTNSNGQKVELVAGIEEMQVVYGIGEGDDVKFSRASAMDPADWPQVSSIRVALLSVSDNSPLQQGIDRTFDLLDVEKSVAGDGKARQVFYQTIALRN